MNFQIYVQECEMWTKVLHESASVWDDWLSRNIKLLNLISEVDNNAIGKWTYRNLREGIMFYFQDESDATQFLLKH